MCIPWVDSVLEIGTISVVAENLVLTDRIQQVLANDLLSTVRPVEPDIEHAPSQTGPAGITMFQDNIFHPDDSAPARDHPTNLALQLPPSSSALGAPGHLSLAEQIWRSANSLSLSLSSDISTQEPEMMQLPNSDHTDMESQPESFSFRQAAETGASSSMQSNMQPGSRRAEIIYNQNQSQLGLIQMTRLRHEADQYNRSIWLGAVANSSSTVSSQEGSSANRPSVSPDLQQQILHANSAANPRFSANHDRTSTSGTLLHSQLQGPRNLNQIRRTNSCGGQYEIQKYLTSFEAQEMHEQWRQQQLSQAASELADATVAKTMATSAPGTTNLPAGQNLPLQGWQRDVAISSTGGAATLNTVNDLSKTRRTVKHSNVELMNQVSKIAGPLLRRQSLSALELLKDVDKYQKEAAEPVSNTVPFDVKSTVPVSEPNPAYVQMNRPNPRGQQARALGVEQASSGSGAPVHAGHDEAAVSHMLAERRRRTKQKENFAALRRLVPLISKADKASTLTDTITYLQFLQNKIQEMAAIKEDIDQRCEILENRCKGLKERNQELAEIISKDQPSSAIHLNLVHLNLQSMSSK